MYKNKTFDSVNCRLLQCNELASEELDEQRQRIIALEVAAIGGSSGDVASPLASVNANNTTVNTITGAQAVGEPPVYGDIALFSTIVTSNDLGTKESPFQTTYSNIARSNDITFRLESNSNLEAFVPSFPYTVPSLGVHRSENTVAVNRPLTDGSPHRLMVGGTLTVLNALSSAEGISFSNPDDGSVITRGVTASLVSNASGIESPRIVDHGITGVDDTQFLSIKGVYKYLFGGVFKHGIINTSQTGPLVAPILLDKVILNGPAPGIYIRVKNDVIQRYELSFEIELLA